MKPRIKLMADIVPSIDFDSLEFEKSELLLDGEPVVFAGSHYDSLVWLKHKNSVFCFKQKDVRGRLKLHQNAKGVKND